MTIKPIDCSNPMYELLSQSNRYIKIATALTVIAAIGVALGIIKSNYPIAIAAIGVVGSVATIRNRNSIIAQTIQWNNANKSCKG